MASQKAISFTVLSYLFLALLGYTIYGGICRLYFSPVAKFPGPKLAALTFWYEFYYDVVKRGRYTWKIIELHEQYGPIVRINPYEVHINDPDFYDEVYPGPSKRSDKWEWSAGMYGITRTSVSAVPHDLHRMRRGAISHFFSKLAVYRLEPSIQAIVDKLCDRMREAYGSKQLVNLKYAYSGLTTDVITEYCFAKSYNSLSYPDFAADVLDMWMKISEATHMIKQFPWFVDLMRVSPDWLVRMVNPPLYGLIQVQKGYGRQIEEVKAELSETKAERTTEKPYSRTIFHSILTSDLPASEHDTLRLVDEAQALIGAGTITTASMLKITTYHVLANPHILQKLVAELDNAIPDPSDPLPLQRLEQLKYLSAVINEGFRLSYGTSHRFQRVFRDRALQFHDWTIEPGTPVSMSGVAMHTNPNIFPDPQTFDPDRWLANSLSETPDIPSSRDSDSLGINDRYNTRLDKYLVPFLKGSRACAGMNLAYAEIYLTLANVLRRFDMQLSGVVRERDVDVIHDFLNTSPSLESTGMKVLVTGVRE